MRRFGFALLAAGILAFLYCGSRLAGLDPVPPGTPVEDYMSYEAGKWEIGRFLAAVAGFVGLVLAALPGGRA